MMLARSVRQTRLLQDAANKYRGGSFSSASRIISREGTPITLPNSLLSPQNYSNLVLVRWNFTARRIDKIHQLRKSSAESSSSSSSSSSSTTTTPNATGNTVAGKAAQKPWRERFKRLAQFVRFSRIVIGVSAVYGLGYQQGVISCTRKPRLMEDELLQTVLADVGVRSKEQVQVFTSEDRPSLHSLTASGMLQAKTIRIGNDIIRVASLYVREQLIQAKHKVEANLPLGVTQEEAQLILKSNEEYRFWEDAVYRVEGENLAVPWKYILVESHIPNAFVSEILPQRFFITSSMFTLFIANEDELAVVLGHEMAHLVLGHVSERNAAEMTLRTIEVLLLAIDPTEGLLSLGIIGGLAWLRGILMASFSRENESQADELGLKLAAMACYDTRNGATVMKKMHDYQVKVAGDPSNNSHLLQLMDTHPPSLDRYNKILKLSETENPDKYGHSTCATVQRKLYKAVWG